jgi:hypothetical protein
MTAVWVDLGKIFPPCQDRPAAKYITSMGGGGGVCGGKGGQSITQKSKMHMHRHRIEVYLNIGDTTTSPGDSVAALSWSAVEATK